MTYWLSKFLIALLTLTLLLPNARAEVFFDFVQDSLARYGEHSNSNQLLETLNSKNPMLKIIVLDQEFELFETEELITFKDPSVSTEDFQFYNEYSNTMVQNVAFYMAPGIEMVTSPGRPLIDSPLLVLKKNAPLHALYHEMGHFFLDQRLRQGKLDSPKNPDLKRLVDGVAEESFVDTLLLENLELFRFDEEALCRRQKYLAQNNQVYDFLLKEQIAQKASLSDPDQKILNELFQLYSRGRQSQMKWHTQCFFFNLQTRN